MNKKMLDALNNQLNYEASAFYCYLAKAAYFEELGFRGFGKWFSVQAAEEQEHMMKFYDYIISRDVKVTLKDVKAPQQNWKNPRAVFEDSLRQEKDVTSKIYSLVDLSLSERDYATHQFLQWFVSEQVEEEAIFTDILHKFDIIADNKMALVLLDKELGARTK